MAEPAPAPSRVPYWQILLFGFAGLTLLAVACSGSNSVETSAPGTVSEEAVATVTQDDPSAAAPSAEAEAAPVAQLSLIHI